MSQPARLLLWVSLAVLLGACTSTPVKRSAPAPAMDSQTLALRRAAVRDWSMNGRIAVASAGKGGSGGIQWRQNGARYTIILSAPVTGRHWTLYGDDHGARLDGMDGDTRSGADVQALLRQATGWSVPFQALASWVRGIAADQAHFGPVQINIGANGQPTRIEQAGWSVTYQWPANGQAMSDPALPRGVVAAQGDTKVRLVIDQWQLPGGEALGRSGMPVGLGALWPQKAAGLVGLDSRPRTFFPIGPGDESPALAWSAACLAPSRPLFLVARCWPDAARKSHPCAVADAGGWVRCVFAAG